MTYTVTAISKCDPISLRPHITIRLAACACIWLSLFDYSQIGSPERESESYESKMPALLRGAELESCSGPSMLRGAELESCQGRQQLRGAELESWPATQQLRGAEWESYVQ